MSALNVVDVETRKAEVAAAAGLDAGRIHSVRLDIQRLLQEGFLVDIDLHNFACLRAAATWKELGIHSGDKRRDRIQKGQKTSVPLKYARKLKSLEVRFRQSVTRYSFDVSALKPWAWIPTTAWESWKSDWEELQNDLAVFKSELKTDLGQIAVDNRTYFQSVARRAWVSYQTPDDNAVVITPDGSVLEGYAAFEADVVDSAMAQCPSFASVDQITADYKTGFLLLPPEVIDYYAETTAQTEGEWGVVRKATAEAALAETLARKTKWEQVDRERGQQARLDAIRKAEYAHTRQQLEDSISPLNEIMLQFRDRIYSDIVSILASLKKNGSLVGRSGTQARGLRDLYALLARCTNDTELEAALEDLSSSLDKPGPGKTKYDLEAVEVALNSVAEITQDAANELRRQTAHQTVAGYLEL